MEEVIGEWAEKHIILKKGKKNKQKKKRKVDLLIHRGNTHIIYIKTQEGLGFLKSCGHWKQVENPRNESTISRFMIDCY